MSHIDDLARKEESKRMASLKQSVRDVGTIPDGSFNYAYAKLLLERCKELYLRDKEAAGRRNQTFLTESKELSAVTDALSHISGMTGFRTHDFEDCEKDISTMEYFLAIFGD